MRSSLAPLTQVFSGLRFRLLLLLLVSCAPLVALTLHSALQDRRQAKANWIRSARNLAQIAHNEEQDLMRNTRQTLLAASEIGDIQSLNEGFARKALADLNEKTPRFSNMLLVTTNGAVIASPVQVHPEFGHRQFLARARQGFVASRFPLTGGKADKCIYFGYPVLQKDGSPVAIVVAELNLAEAKSEVTSRVPKNAHWMAVNAKGDIMRRYPQPEEWVGKRLDPALVADIFAQKDGIAETTSAGATRMSYAFHVTPSRMAGGEVAYMLGQPRQTLFAQADNALRRNLSGLGLAVGIALALGWVGSKLLILRPVQALVNSSARLAAGDLSARTGLTPSRDELGQLTMAFDQMAQSLQLREQERQRSSLKLQALSQKLVDVQESERRHIARELHDEIGQSLTAAGMNLQAALQMKGPAALERRLQESVQAVERVLDQVHDLSLSLRPSMLDDLGLEPALRWYTHRQAALTGLRAEFRADPLQERLDPMVETECFRVAQEALTNVVRHAHARSVSVELTHGNGKLQLSVRDDGVGFNVSTLRDDAVHGASLGLLSMEERATLAGGGLEFVSVPGQGTEVHAWFPLKPRPVLSISELNE